MKSFLRILVGVFEIVSGGAGVYWVIAGLTGRVSRDVAAMLWYGVFPVAAILAGVLLLLRKKYGFGLSVVILALQVLVIKTSLFSLNVGVAFSLTTSAYWAARPGESGVILGINFLAVAVLVALWVSRSGRSRVPDKVESIEPVGRTSKAT